MIKLDPNETADQAYEHGRRDGHAEGAAPMPELDPNSATDLQREAYMRGYAEAQRAP